MRLLVLAGLTVLVGCGSTDHMQQMQTGGGSGGSNGAGGGAASTGGGAASTGGGSSGTGGGSPAIENCLGKQLLDSLGKARLMVGMRTNVDSLVSQAPWDVRYNYITAGIADGDGPCTSCRTNCTSGGVSCAGGGCAWYGCWQDDALPPGAYLRDFIASAKAKGLLPMFTYYEQLYSTGAAEGSMQIVKMKDATTMRRYFNDFRFTLQQIGMEKALVHLEPDTWGYGQQANANPHLTQVAVATANPTDCAAQENTFAGFGHCMLAMARKYAPNAKVGFHASSWATNMDVFSNSSPTFDVVAEATKTADFLKACGAADGDFVVVEASDRDAGYYFQNGDTGAFWDITNTSLPNFHQAFLWARTISEKIGRPLLWWQLPVGNMTLDPIHRDNRVDYFFAHTDEVAATHAVLMAFGPGEDSQTWPETDNGNLINKTKSYVTGGGQPLSCP